MGPYPVLRLFEVILSLFYSGTVVLRLLGGPWEGNKDSWGSWQGSKKSWVSISEFEVGFVFRNVRLKVNLWKAPGRITGNSVNVLE